MLIKLRAALSLSLRLDRLILNGSTMKRPANNLHITDGVHFLRIRSLFKVTRCHKFVSIHLLQSSFARLRDCFQVTLNVLDKVVEYS